MLDPTKPRPSPGPGELGVTFEQPDARHALLVVEGEIDTLTAGSLERALTELLNHSSEVLVMGVPAAGVERANPVVLLALDQEVELGARVF